MRKTLWSLLVCLFVLMASLALAASPTHRAALLGGGKAPSLSCNFLGGNTANQVSGALSVGPNCPTMTFTRGSVGTYFDATGTMQTAASNIPRFDYNPATLAARGFLSEVSSTNILLNSASLSTQSVTTTATPYTLTFYGTGTVTLSGTFSGSLVGSGAFPTRSTLTFTPTAGTLTATVTGTVTDAQLEALAFSTSYIPTTGTSVTRSADIANLTASASWFNPQSYTMSVRFLRPASILLGDFLVAMWKAGPFQEGFEFGGGASNLHSFNNTRTNTQNATIGTVNANAVMTASISFSPTTTISAFTGSATITFNSGAVTTVPTTLGVGSSAGVSSCECYVQTLQIWPTALSAGELP